jgi:flagellar basal-body rod protein FlgF
MDRLIYTSLTAMQRLTEAQGVTAHNLANANTPGFRREMMSFGAGFLVAREAEMVTRAQSGAEATHDLLRAGKAEVTGRALDMMMEGGAWLAVLGPDGAEALTRRADLRLSEAGELLTGDGHRVLGADGPILVGAGFDSVRIAPDGSVETRVGPEAPFVAVGRVRLVSPDPATLRRGGDGLFRTPAPLAADPLARVSTGVVERSNVEPSAVLVELIEQSRGFEMQAKLLSSAREMDERSAALMRVEG